MLCISLLVVFSANGPAYSQELQNEPEDVQKESQSRADDNESSSEVRRRLEDQEQLIRQQHNLLQRQQQKIRELEIRMGTLEEEGAPESTSSSTPRVGQAPPTKTDRPIQAADVIESRGVLTHKGTLIIEPGLQYSYSSVTRVALEGFTIIPAITIGAIDVREVDRNTMTATLSARYGVTNHLEVGIKIPYVRRDDTTITRPLAEASEEDVTTKADGSGLGDIEITFNYMFNEGRGDGPYFVGSLRAKSRTGTDPFETKVDSETGLQKTLPTGTGFVSVQPGLSISVPSDPAVFYGSLTYLRNIGREVNPSVGRIDPGNATGVSFGMAFAVNPRASFSLGYSHNTVAETKQNGVTLPGSDRLQVGSLLMGLSHRIGGRRNLNISVGAGLTDDAPDVQISFRMPIAYSLTGG